LCLQLFTDWCEDLKRGTTFLFPYVVEISIVIFIRQPKISETALVAETIRTDFLFSKINSSILHLTHSRLNTFERIENHEFALDDELCTKITTER